ncbi:MAG TPA: hypothetical protein VIJ09_02030 [Acidimicrobiales bacterium]
MARSRRPGKGVPRALLGWLLVAPSVSLCFSLVWDADGNPNTDNLPLVALPVTTPAVADVESRSENHDDPTG